MAIINGFYHPNEIMDALVHKDKNTGELLGDCSVAVCVGNRTGGKTVGFALEMIRDYLEKGERNILTCRTIKVKEKGYLRDWWKKTLDIEDDLGLVKRLKERGNIGFNDDVVTVGNDIFSYCCPLSASSQIKDTGKFAETTKILMDEAIQPFESSLIINGRSAMSRIWEIWFTAARGWEQAMERTNIILVSNSTERDNWVFNDLNINKWFRKGAKLCRNNGVIVENVVNKVASDKVMGSVMGAVMSNSKSGQLYLESAVDNKFGDNTSGIRKLGLDFKKIYMQIKTEGIFLGFFDAKEFIHVEEIQKDKRSDIYCVDPREMEEGISFSADGKLEQLIRNAYECGSMSFGSQRAKNATLRLAGLLKRRD